MRRDDDPAAAGQAPWQPPLSEYSVYMTPSEEHRSLGLALHGAGWHTIAEHGIRWDARVLNCYALHVLTRGSGWIEWGDRPRTRLPIKAPAAFWLFPGVVHSYQPEAGGWTITWALFDGPAAAGYEDLDFQHHSGPRFPPSRRRPARAGRRVPRHPLHGAVSRLAQRIPARPPVEPGPPGHPLRPGPPVARRRERDPGVGPGTGTRFAGP